MKLDEMCFYQVVQTKEGGGGTTTLEEVALDNGSIVLLDVDYEDQYFLHYDLLRCAHTRYTCVNLPQTSRKFLFLRQTHQKTPLLSVLVCEFVCDLNHAIAQSRHSRQTPTRSLAISSFITPRLSLLTNLTRLLRSAYTLFININKQEQEKIFNTLQGRN